MAGTPIGSHSCFRSCSQRLRNPDASRRRARADTADRYGPTAHGRLAMAVRCRVGLGLLRCGSCVSLGFCLVGAQANAKARMKIASAALSISVAAVYLFLLLPIAIVVLASFNAAEYLSFPPTGLSFRWYSAFLSSPSFTSAFFVSII